MKDGKKLIITIGRQFGSGGSEIGRQLATELGLGFYDKNILRMDSDESGIKESFYYMTDEKAGNKLLYKIIKGMTPEIGSPLPGLGPGISGQSVPLPVGSYQEAGGRGGLYVHWAVRRLCAGGNGRAGPDVPLRGHGLPRQAYNGKRIF